MSTEAPKPGDWLARVVPAVAWLRGYSRSDLNADVVGGLVTAVLLIPQAMALGILAGLPPEVGLYASITAPIAYAFFGSSRILAVGPVAVAAIMVAEALAAPEVRAHGSAVGNALVLAFECGVILLVMSALRVGAMVNLLSHPVLAGFTSAAAILIILTQVPSLLGIAAGTDTTASYEIVGFVFRQLAAIEPATLLLGIVSIALLGLAMGPLQALLRTQSGRERAALLARATPLFVVFVTTLVVVGFDLDHTRGVATVGEIPVGLPRPDLGFLRLNTWVALLPSAALIALIAYVESVSMAKILANRRRQRISANQELLALGAANLAAAFTAGMPVAGSFSRTMVNFAAGARTQVASLVVAATIALMLLFFAPLFERLPRAALAAIIVVAVAPLVDAGAVRRLWRYQRSDAGVMLLTFGGVLIFGIEVGLVLGVLQSLAAYVWRTSRPHVAVVGRIPGTEHFRNVLRYDVETWPPLALIRVDESLSFANIGAVEDCIMAHVAKHREVKHVVLVCSAINHVDSSALEALERLVVSLREGGVTIHLAEVKGPVLDVLDRAGLPEQLAPGRIFFRTAEAVEALAAAKDAPTDGEERRDAEQQHRQGSPS